MTTEGDHFLIDGRPVPELKVVELRKELEIRSLPKSGNKKELVDRLLNFLREEQEELTKQQETPQEEGNQEEKQSPTASHSLPDMVSQYLVQQQIQLEAARRDADKIRASSSYDPTSTDIQTQMVQQTEHQLIGDEVPETSENFPQDHEEDTNEYVPEEPSGSPQEQLQPAESHLQQTETVEILQEDSQQEASEEDESESDGKERASTESSVTEEGYADIGGDEDTTPAAEENAALVGEERIIEPNAKDGHVDQQGDEEQSQSFTEENAEVEGSTEFVPDEPEHKKKRSETDYEEPNNGSTKSAEESTAKDEESDIEVGSQKDNSDDEYERDDIVDDAGKRRRQTSPFGKKKMDKGGLDETRRVGENEEECADDRLKEGEFLFQNVPWAVAEQISSTAESNRTERRRSSTLTGVEMLESSKPPIEQQKEEITPDGFIRKRAASPARNPPSRWVHIRGLKRPYTQRALLELLGKFGIVDEGAFWIDSIKSNCIVTYETIEQAELARERLHNVIWPAASTDSLCVEFSTDDKLRRRQAEEQSESNSKLRRNDMLDSLPENGGRSGGGLGGLTIVVDNRHPISSGAQVHIQHEKEQQREAEIRKRKAEELEKSQDKLNQLFKKTKVQPSLYFLPLSDAEAAQHQANKNKKQSSSTSKNNSSTRDRPREHRRDNDNHHQRSSHHSSHQKNENDRRRMATSGNRR
uniref:SAP domain-containing protein n=1 Tax=Meloidogyne incognita TaxID=6306 RepID=A0A914N202_MELIC